MKFFNLLLVFAASVGVLASKTAGGWEAVMYYYMYRMDYDVNGEGGTIGKGCKGSPGHSKGGCNFAQFVDFYQKHTIGRGRGSDGQKLPPAGKFDPTKVPKGIDLENPDITKASGIMDWDGTKNPQFGNKLGVEEFFKYDASYDKAKLLGAKANGANNHGDVLGRLADVMDGVRTKAGDAKIQDQLDKVRGCMGNVILARQMDNAANLVRDFQIVVLDKIANTAIKDKNNKLVSPTKDFIDPDSGETYKVWDSDKMANDVSSNPELSEDKKKELHAKISEYATDYNVKAGLSEKPGSSGATHYRDITAAQAIGSRLKSPPRACK